MTDWVSICEAISICGGSEHDARSKIVGMISANVLDARAFKAKSNWMKFDRADDLEIFATVATARNLQSCNFPWPFRLEPGEVETNREVGPSDLLWQFAFDDEGWRKEIGPRFTLQEFRADWTQGHFQRRMLSYAVKEYGDLENVGFFYREEDLYGLEVWKEGLTKLVGITSEPKQETGQAVGRRTTYDWEAAFADVAARLYLDVQFPDLEARGVQTELIGLLRDSFEERRLPVPAFETLKPKAKKILGALRSKKP